MTSIGIDIGTFSLKLVEVKASPSLGYEILNVESFSLSQNSQLKDRDLEIIEILRPWILNKYSSEQNFFVLSLQKNQFFYRKLHFPFQQRHKILKSLPFQLEDDIPFSKQDLVYDIKLTQYIDSGAEGVAVASPKKNLQDLIRFTKQFHVNPDMVSLPEIALWNLLVDEKRGLPHKKTEGKNENSSDKKSSLKNKTHDSKEASGTEEEKSERENLKKEEASKNSFQICLNIGHKKTLILIFKENLLLEFESLDWGGDSVIRRRMEDSSQSYSEVLREFQEITEKSRSNESDESENTEQFNTKDCYKSIKNSTLEFSDSFYRILMEMKEKHKLDYQNILLTGGGALIPYMESVITECTGLPIQKMGEDIFSAHLASSDLASKMKDSLKLSCSVALGLALEGLKKPRNPALNLLKGEFAKKSHKLENFMKKWATLLKTSAALFLILVLYSSFRASFTSSMAQKGESLMKDQAFKVASLKSSNATPSGIHRFLKRQKKKEKSTELIEKIFKNPSPLDILKKISESFPARKELPMKILALNLNHENLYLEIATQSESLVKKLETTLEAFSKDKELKIRPLTQKLKKKEEENSSQKGTSSKQNLLFSIEIKMKTWGKI